MSSVRPRLTSSEAAPAPTQPSHCSGLSGTVSKALPPCCTMRYCGRLGDAQRENVCFRGVVKGRRKKCEQGKLSDERYSLTCAVLYDVVLQGVGGMGWEKHGRMMRV